VGRDLLIRRRLRIKKRRRAQGKMDGFKTERVLKGAGGEKRRVERVCRNVKRFPFFQEKSCYRTLPIIRLIEIARNTTNAQARHTLKIPNYGKTSAKTGGKKTNKKNGTHHEKGEEEVC